MRLLLVATLLGFVLVGLPASTSPKSTPGHLERERGLGNSNDRGADACCHDALATVRMTSSEVRGRPSGDGRSQKEQPDISRSGRDFLEVCASAGIEKDSQGSRDEARVSRDATCLGWVAGFAEGFLVHDELLGVPRRDRLACVPNGESAVRIVRVMKKYLADHPEKARRATRYIASLALAGAFPCKGCKVANRK